MPEHEKEPDEAEQAVNAGATLFGSATGQSPDWLLKLSPLISALFVASATAIQLGSSFAAIEVRWTVALLVGVLCAVAVAMPLLGVRRQDAQTNRLTYVYCAGILIASLVVTTDTVLLYLKYCQPADCLSCKVKPRIAENGVCVPCIKLDRQHYFARTADIVLPVSGRPSRGELLDPQCTFIDLKLQKRSHVARATIDDVRVKVVSFTPLGRIWDHDEPQPPLCPKTDDNTTDLQIPFIAVGLTDDRRSQLPWDFPAQFLLEGQTKEPLPWWRQERQLTEESPYQRLHVYIYSDCPGLFSIDIYVKVNDQQIKANQRPIDCFFYQFLNLDESELLRQRIHRIRANPIPEPNV
jgi:hypothetical protein